MSKSKLESSRSQLSMLLPIVSKPVVRSTSVGSFVVRTQAGRFVRVDEHRKAALKNLEKSGLRSPNK
jgi:hypothetical protein